MIDKAHLLITDNLGRKYYVNTSPRKCVNGVQNAIKTANDIVSDCLKHPYKTIPALSIDGDHVRPFRHSEIEDVHTRMRIYEGHYPLRNRFLLSTNKQIIHRDRILYYYQTHLHRR